MRGKWVGCKDKYHERTGASMIICRNYSSQGDLCGVMLITRGNTAPLRVRELA
jgi:hypothetical protein